MFVERIKSWEEHYEKWKPLTKGYVREGWMGITKNCLDELASLFDHIPVTHGKRKVEVMQMGIADDDYLSFSAIDILKRIEEEAADEDRANIPQAAFAFTEFVEPLNPRHMEIAASLISTMVYERALAFHERSRLLSFSDEAKEQQKLEERELGMEGKNIDADKDANNDHDKKNPDSFDDEKNDYPGHRLKEKFESIDAKWMPTIVVSIGNRGAGALAHAVASYLKIPYSLTNWYPDGSEGEVRVDRCAGIGGPGWVYLNGVPPNSRVLVVLDAIHTGRNAQHVVEAVLKVSECVVWGVYIVCEIVNGKPRERICKLLQDDIPVDSLIRVNLGSSNNNASSTTSYTRIKTVEVKPAVRNWLYNLRTLYGMKVELNEEYRKVYERSKDLMKCAWKTVIDDDPKYKQGFIVEVNNFNECEGKDLVIGSRCVLPRRDVPSYAAMLKKMRKEALKLKMDNVTSAFVNVPIVVNDKVAYPYCYFALTDFKPALQPQLVEDMADLCIYYSNLHECDVLVSEGDRGGGPLLQAISIRVNKPYVIASWTVDETETNNSSSTTSAENDNNDTSDKKHPENETNIENGDDKTGENCPKKSTACSAVTSVGFSGNCNRLCLRGLKPNMRCAFVDDMLSSGGTADAVLHCIEELGAIPEEAVFISEKLYPTEKWNFPQHDSVPSTIASQESNAVSETKLLRKGQRRLHNLFPQTKITTVVQFVVEGSCTTSPKERVGPFTCVKDDQVK